MKRIVLAFLALLGLVAQSAPVQARMCGVEQVGAVTAVRAQRQALTAQVAPSAAAVAKPDRKDRECTSTATERKRPVYIPAVQLGSDRARE
ncbi:hypothetical protein OKA06_10225 [Novosphingobium sp. MW5]|nr:hypothetical protein [Novosphingobium sp. MW5]